MVPNYAMLKFNMLTDVVWVKILIVSLGPSMYVELFIIYPFFVVKNFLTYMDISHVFNTRIEGFCALEQCPPFNALISPY